MKNRSGLIICLVCLSLALASFAQAEVNLRFTPADTSVTAGVTNRLAIFVDDLDANVRTIDIYVTYDTTIVASVGGGAGRLYQDSGFFVFQGLENNIPGQWHGYAVVMGSTDYLEGPGELFYWEFEGLALGTTPIVAVEAYVADGNGVYDPDVILDGTTITVYDPQSAVDDVPVRQSDLKVWPNPFNPRTSLLVEMAEAGHASMSVYDVRGHELIVLHNGNIPAGSSTFTWDGCDDKGQMQPAGQYFFRLATGHGVKTTRAMLVK